MKVYIINLEKDKNRLQNVINQLESNQITNYQRIPGIYGKELNLKNFPKNLSHSQIGCFLSHVQTLYQIIKDDVDMALVLEDDIVLSEWFPKLEEIINTLPKNFDICWVGNCRAKWPRNPCNIIPEPSYDYNELEQINDFVWKVDGNSIDNYPMGAYGLVFSKEGAKKSLKNALDNGYTNTIDVIYVKSDVEKYMTIPSIITHCYDFGTNISAHSELKINPFENVWKKNPKQEIACLEILQKLTESGLNYSIIYGTLLGYARNKKFISYDDDIDIIIHKKELKKFESMINELKKDMNIYKLDKNNQDLFYKLYPKDDSGYNYKYPFIDIFIYDHILYEERPLLLINNNYFDMTDEIEIGYIKSYTTSFNYKIKVFKDYKKILDRQYPNWENICISNHRLSKFLCKNIIYN